MTRNRVEEPQKKVNPQAREADIKV